MKKGMIKVSALYPNGNGKRFDNDYYFNKHIPFVLGLLGDKVKSGAVEKGLAGGAPGAPAAYLIMAHFYFESMQDFEQTFGPNAEKIMADIANFTNIAPMLQVSEVVI